MVAAQQLREEVYNITLKKLELEEKLKSMCFYIATLKRELDQRMLMSQ
ncbi:MAG: hypothetical protein KKF48_02275 [Nanoarchaeota archaeon]|nr:hypothetical protein [Nanoarchaeota archaeon]MBU1027846.1 hypothetical protein [Nanoarchaeota archaeon]